VEKRLTAEIRDKFPEFAEKNFFVTAKGIAVIGRLQPEGYSFSSSSRPRVGLCFSNSFGLLLAIRHNLAGTWFANSFSRQRLHCCDRTKWFLLF